MGDYVNTQFSLCCNVFNRAPIYLTFRKTVFHISLTNNVLNLQITKCTKPRRAKGLIRN